MKFLVAALVVVFAFHCGTCELLAQRNMGGPAVILMEQEARPFLGVQFTAAPDDGGIQVLKVLPDSPAAKAGLKAGDAILEIDGVEIDELRMLPERLSKKKIGDAVELLVLRSGEQVKLSAELGDSSDYQLPTITTSGLKADEPKSGEFDSADGLTVTVDAYAPYPAGSVPSILLCHQAGWSRGEYQEIAPKLNEIGFNCFAIDQRSGGGVNDVENETNKRAKAAGKGVAFLDAEQDIVAALKYVRNNSGKSKVILWGSSYSAALSLRIAGEHPELVDGVLAFAPGEYFARFGKADNWVETSAKKIASPTFITSAKKELKNWKSIYDSIPGDSKAMFVPETKGNHGSRALWEKFDDHDAYWKATTEFLTQFVEADNEDKK